jgi:mono/diheme cytochrome c family protein/plastocyanin
VKTRFEKLAALLAGLALLAGGCKPAGHHLEASTQKQTRAPGSQATPAQLTFSEVPVPPEPADRKALLARGKLVYAQNCAACHGVKGDGQGKCAAFLVPHPRDFTAARFKFRSTPLGDLPTDADLFRIISHGVQGTPMPPWKWLLDDTDRWAAVEYIKTFSPRFSDPKEDRRTLVDLGNPIPRTAAGIAEGKVLYTKAGCLACHGLDGVGDGPSAATLVDYAGQHIAPRDFSRPATFKAGYSAREIVRTVLTGLDGTPMPSFANMISRADAWKVAYYVQTFARPEVVPVEPPSHGFADRTPLGPPDVRVKLIERAWKYVPDTIIVKKGQVLKVTFEPTDNGLGAGHGFAVSGYDEEAFINGAMVGAPKTVKFRADRAGKFTFYCATQCSTGKLHALMTGTLIVQDPSAIQTASAK